MLKERFRDRIVLQDASHSLLTNQSTLAEGSDMRFSATVTTVMPPHTAALGRLAPSRARKAARPGSAGNHVLPGCGETMDIYEVYHQPASCECFLGNNSSPDTSIVIHFPFLRCPRFNIRARDIN